MGAGVFSAREDGTGDETVKGGAPSQAIEDGACKGRCARAYRVGGLLEADGSLWRMIWSHKQQAMRSRW